MMQRWWRPVLALLFVLCTAPALAQDAEEAAEHAEPGEVPYASQSDRELRHLRFLLGADHWHYRCFGLMRLERFVGEPVEAHVLAALEDRAWQVRCFAIRTAVRKEIEIPAELFAQEDEPRVLRVAQRAGIALDAEQVGRYAERELRSNVPERVMLGIELAAASGDERLHGAAVRMMGRLLENMDTMIMVTIGDRLSELLGMDRPPYGLEDWAQYMAEHRGRLVFPDFSPQVDEMRAQALSPIAALETEAFLAVINYMDTLHEQDLEIAVVIDGTGSMGYTIERAQGSANRLMLILNDLAKSMRMGVVIYRDQIDTRTTEVHRLDDDIHAVRRFLFGIVAEGGDDIPEDIHAGLDEVYRLGWSRAGNKQVVLIGDAHAHPRSMDDIRNQVTQLGHNNIPVHTLWTGEEPELIQCFEQIAEWGRGRSSAMDPGVDFGKTIMHYGIEPSMHETFDHFYDLYVELCM